MLRGPHKCGVKGSRCSKDEKRKRGISKEQVCVKLGKQFIFNYVKYLNKYITMYYNKVRTQKYLNVNYRLFTN